MKALQNFFFISMFLVLPILEGMAQNTGISGNAGSPSNPPATRTGPALYDQISNPGTGFVVSQEFTDAASTLNSSQLADDFTVPAGETWNIGTVAIIGYYFYGSPGGIPDAVNVFIYDDNNGLPGSEVYSMINVPTFTIESTITASGYEQTYIEVSLAPSVALTAGTYWLSFQVVGDYSVIGQWGWGDAANDPQIGSQFHWQNPGNGFGTGFTTWTPGSMVIWFGYLDCAFALYEVSYNHDLAAKGIAAPVSSETLGASETITMTMKNEGLMSETGFNVSYSVNGGTPVVENVGSFSINPEIYANYSFATTADLSQPGIYDIEVTTLLTGDQYAGNDSYTKQVVNYGTVYLMEDGTNITACSGTFTDPGGINGNFGMNDAATMTIYPETTGQMARLTFVEFDVYWSDFYIYDGENTDAPLIGYYQTTNSPGVVTALNSTGALTIDFAAPGWADGKGWVAVISCYDQPEDDFIVTAFSHDPATLFNGLYFDLTATVRNIGSMAQAKNVTFYVDGNPIGTINTGTLQPTEYATVTMQTSIATVGTHSASVSLPADQGEDPANNMAEIDLEVYLQGSLVEFFENPSFPPDFWESGPYWSEGTGTGFAFQGEHAAHAFVDAGFYDTLWTPQLVINTGDSISFYAKTSGWWYGGLTVIYRNAITNEVGDIEALTLNDVRFEKFEIDISAAIGNSYIGFVAYVNDFWSWQGEVMLDNVVGKGPELYFPDHDMTCYDLTGNVTPTVNEPATFDLTVRNIGALDVPAGSYTVQLVRALDGGSTEVLQSAGGQALQHLQKTVFTFTHTFDASGPAHVFGRVLYSPDLDTTNNSTPVTLLNVQVAGTVQVEVGDGETESWYLPLSSTSPYSVSETIYPDGLIPVTGMITGIKYYYRNNGYEPHVSVPVQLWMETTTEPDMTFGWTNSTDMTNVVIDTIDLLVGEHELYLPFDLPYGYSGGNLMVLFFKDMEDPQVWADVTFQCTLVEDTLTRWTSSYQVIDPAWLDSTAGPGVSELAYPDATFFVNTAGLGEVGGTVYNENGEPFPGVQVKMDGYNVVTVTDGSGVYFFNEILAGSQSFTASVFAYEDNTQPVDVVAGIYNALDFNMVLKPLVTVTGTLVGNDDPEHYLEGANVTLSGYFNFGATSGPEGGFLLSSVYGNESYSLTIKMEGYQDYVDDVQVTGEDLDLGTIVMVEEWDVPFAVNATNDGSIVVEWMVPNTGDDMKYDYDPDLNNGYANEPYENVWLGNIYETGTRGSITSVSIYWLWYSTFSGWVTLDIMDSTGHVIMSSEPFQTEKDDWTHIDIPDVAFDQTFYAMVHWQNNPETTDFLAIEEDINNTGVPHYGYIDYPDWEEPMPLSVVLGHEGTFDIVVNTIVEGETRSYGSRWLESYNVYRGLLSDVVYASAWEPLNTEPVTGTSFIDDTWPPQDSGEYVFAVRALFSTGESVMSFSNPLTYSLPVYIGEPGETDGIDIYPNPATDWVYVTVPEENTRISILNTSGKLMAEYIAAGRQVRVRVSDLPDGIYLVRITTGSTTSTKKLIKN